MGLLELVQADLFSIRLCHAVVAEIEVLVVNLLEFDQSDGRPRKGSVSGRDANGFDLRLMLEYMFRYCSN